jgi:hypothetical protein
MPLPVNCERWCQGSRQWFREYKGQGMGGAHKLSCTDGERSFVTFGQWTTTWLKAAWLRGFQRFANYS